MRRDIGRRDPVLVARLMFTRVPLAPVWAVFALTAAACTTERVGSFPTEPTLSPAVYLRSPAESLFVGRSMHLVAAATGDSAQVAWPQFVWTSSDTNVVAVDSAGNVLAISPGIARVTASFAGHDASTVVNAVMQRADGGTRFLSAATGFHANCALTVDGGVQCRVPVSGDSVPKYAPVAGSAGFQFMSFTAGILHMCGAQANGVMTCWGDNDQAQLGTGSRLPRTFKQAPATAVTTLRFKAFALGGLANSFSATDTSGTGFTCGIEITSSVVYCVGSNNSGQLGQLPAATADSSFVPVAGGFRAVSVAAAQSTACAISTTATIHCWGGTATFSSGGAIGALRLVPFSGQPASITIGLQHACVLTVDGHAYCWGSNGSGQLGFPLTGATLPTPVSSTLTFRELQAGERHTCGISVAGDLYCWGDFLPASLSVRLGSRRFTPFQLARGIKFRSISSNRINMCGVTVEDRIVCM